MLIQPTQKIRPAD